MDFADLDSIGDGLLLAQLLRDMLAIHDDIVDEDLDKFGAAPLPVALSAADGAATMLTKRGKDLALYYGDFLVAVMLHVASALPAGAGRRVTRLIADTLYVNQRGQLAELLTEDHPINATTLDDLLLIGQRKAAYYCYAFPFALGADIAGPARRLLVRLGTASQVIDDITGAFPGVIDDDKDTLGEIMHLRRTVPLVLLARSNPQPEIQALLAAPPPLSADDALRLRDALWHSDIPRHASDICRQLLADIDHQLAGITLGAAPTAYLHDLVNTRLRRKIDDLSNALGPEPTSDLPGSQPT